MVPSRPKAQMTSSRRAARRAGRRSRAAAGSSRGAAGSSRRVLHRLDEDGGDGVGALHLDGDLDLVGGPAAERLEVVAVLGRAVEVGVRCLVGARHQRLEVLLRVGDARDRQGSLRRAVVGDGPADDLVLHRSAGQLEVLLGDLPRGLDGLAAARGEEDPVEVAGRGVGQPLGELDRLGVGVRPQREERELAGLLRRGLGELRTAVPHLDDEQAPPARRGSAGPGRPRCRRPRRAR
jgi:hypothetical protein